MAIKTMESDDTSSNLMATSAVMSSAGKKAAAYSNCGSFGAAKIVKPMKSLSTAILDFPNNVPTNASDLFASDGVSKVIVATCIASCAEEVGHRETCTTDL